MSIDLASPPRRCSKLIMLGGEFDGESIPPGHQPPKRFVTFHLTDERGQVLPDLRYRLDCMSRDGSIAFYVPDASPSA